jgi:hypothetical protein
MKRIVLAALATMALAAPAAALPMASEMPGTAAARKQVEISATSREHVETVRRTFESFDRRERTGGVAPLEQLVDHPLMELR